MQSFPSILISSFWISFPNIWMSRLISLRKNMQSFPSISILPFRLSYTSVLNSIAKVFHPNKKSLIRFDNSLSSANSVNFMCEQLRGEAKIFYGDSGVVVSIEGARCTSWGLKNNYHAGYNWLAGYRSYFGYYFCKTIYSSQYESDRWSGISINIIPSVGYWLSYSTKEITASFCQCVDYVKHKVLFQTSLLSNFALQLIGKNISNEQKISYDYGVSPSYKYLICEEKGVNVTPHQSSNYSFAAQRA